MVYQTVGLEPPPDAGEGPFDLSATGWAAGAARHEHGRRPDGAYNAASRAFAGATQIIKVPSNGVDISSGSSIVPRRGRCMGGVVAFLPWGGWLAMGSSTRVAPGSGRERVLPTGPTALEWTIRLHGVEGRVVASRFESTHGMGMANRRRRLVPLRRGRRGRERRPRWERGTFEQQRLRARCGRARRGDLVVLAV